MKKFLELQPKYNSWSKMSFDDFIESKDGKTIIVYGHAKGTSEPNPDGLWRFILTIRLDAGKVRHILDSWRAAHEDSEQIYGTVYIKGHDWSQRGY